MDADSLLHIFEHLPLIDVMMLGRMNDDFSSLVEVDLRQKLAHRTVCLGPNPLSTHSYDFEMTSKKVFIHTTPNIMRMLTEFGHLFKNLYVGPAIDYETGEAIYQLIDERCRETLVKFELHVSSEENLPTSMPLFNLVEEFHLTMKRADLSAEILNFRKFSPLLRRLFLHVHLLENSGNKSQEIPQIEELYVIDNGRSKNEAVLQLFEANQQIQTLAIKYVGNELLKAATELPNLKRLELYDCKYRIEAGGNNVYHFEHVNSFKLDRYSSVWPGQISFGDQLTNFEYGGLLSNSEAVDFVIRTKSLQRFTMNIWTNSLLNDEFTQLAAAQLSVTEMAVNLLLPYFEFGNITPLIENNEQLNKLYLRFDQKKSKHIADQLRIKYGAQYTVIRESVWVENVVEITLER